MEAGEITYLYKVKDGSVNQSFALNAAFNMGFAKDLDHRAKQVSFITTVKKKSNMQLLH